MPSKVERAIGSFSRIMCKLQTAYPKMSFEKLVKEAILTMNASPSDGLAPNMSPKDIHFSSPPSNFLKHQEMRNAPDYINMARDASKETLLYEVKRFLRKASTNSPTDNTAKLKYGDFCLKRGQFFLCILLRSWHIK